jgi:23S rRNA (pseudouridine1915-N3)-methyltransferase
MKITLLSVGKTESGYLKTGILQYEERLTHYAVFRHIEIPQIKNPASLSKDQLKEREGVEILKNVKEGDELILLDENGRERSSEEFAQFLEQKSINSTKSIIFVVGGAYGFSHKVTSRADTFISLSRMTFSHQMVRLIFLEQLYRAFTIIKGEPYHHK